MGDVADGQPLFPPFEARACIGASQRLGIQPRDGLGDFVQRGVVGEKIVEGKLLLATTTIWIGGSIAIRFKQCKRIISS